MPSRLEPHHTTPAGPLQAIEADAARPAPMLLAVRFRILGVTPALVLPAEETPGRAEELWRHTCLEAFVAATGSEAYCEANLAPSRRWALYAFDGRRVGMRPAGDVPPSIETSRTGDTFELSATLDLSGVPGLAPEKPWRVALSAVMEANDGPVSYWALRHPPGRPDFHHPDCFALELPASERA